MENPFQYGVRELEVQAHKIRFDIIRALARAGTGHSGGPLGFADIITALYFKFAAIDPEDPDNPKRDRILFSAGHYSPLIYSVLAHAGYFTVDHFLTDYRQFNGHLDGHPNFKTSGIETASGPLGQGTSQAVGLALAAKLDHADWKVWLMMSDGEQQEGQTQEALMWAGARGLDNLIGIIDVNNMQIDGHVSDVLPEKWLAANYRNYGWQVIQVNGNDMDDIVKVLKQATTLLDKGQPILVLARTIPGRGVSFMENDYTWHGKPPKGDEVDRALADLNKIGRKLGVDYV